MQTVPERRVSVEEGVVVGRGGGRDLRADVFRPPSGASNGVGLLLIHGGGWRQGDRTQLRGYGILLGRLGYTSVACEYRLSREATWPAQLHDVKAALRWMRAQAAPLEIDPARIAVSGNSAGGHLSLMLAATQNDLECEGDGGQAGAGTEVAAAIAFYAPVDLGVRATESARAECDESSARARAASDDAEGVPLNADIAALLGPERSAARVRDASPIVRASSAFPPTMLVTGNRDELVPGNESIRMYRALVAVGARAELHVFEGLPHAFDAAPALGRHCASLMALFLDRHVVSPRATTEAEVTAAR